MTSLFLITLLGITVSGKELAIAVVVILIVVGVIGYLVMQGRQKS